LEANAKTVGDWMKAKRLAKNLKPFHVAVKMGIAASLVLSWERGTETPNERQWQTLSNLLSFDSRANFPKPNG
jgi:transcriptional regulator with XRE-family HTH domain